MWKTCRPVTKGSGFAFFALLQWKQKQGIWHKPHSWRLDMLTTNVNAMHARWTHSRLDKQRVWRLQNTTVCQNVAPTGATCCKKAVFRSLQQAACHLVCFNNATTNRDKRHAATCRCVSTMLQQIATSGMPQHAGAFQHVDVRKRLFGQQQEMLKRAID